MQSLRRFQLPGLELEATLLGVEPGTPGPDGVRRTHYVIVPRGVLCTPAEDRVRGEDALRAYFSYQRLTVHHVLLVGLGVAPWQANLFMVFTDEPAPDPRRDWTDDDLFSVRQHVYDLYPTGRERVMFHEAFDLPVEPADWGEPEQEAEYLSPEEYGRG
jgi:hypothetical protein